MKTEMNIHKFAFREGDWKREGGVVKQIKTPARRPPTREERIIPKSTPMGPV
jgi:hypothetical protein